MPKAKKKEKTAAEKLRSLLTIFNPGAAAIQGKVTPEIKKATKKAKESTKRR
jgi:hypothetical protein